MPLVKAVLTGGVAAVAIPTIVRGGAGRLADWLQYGVVQFTLADWHFTWSWPVFCVVTLFTWGLLAWADK